MIKMPLIIIATILVSLLLVALVIPKARQYFIHIVRTTFEDIRNIVWDYTPSKKHAATIWEFLLMLVLVIPILVLVVAFVILAGPTRSIYLAIRRPKEIDKAIERDKEHFTPMPKEPEKTPEEKEAERKEAEERYFATHFNIPKDSLTFLPDILEVVFYTPVSSPEIETMIEDNLEAIKEAHRDRRLSFFYLPEYNRHSSEIDDEERLDYYNPRHGELGERPAA